MVFHRCSSCGSRVSVGSGWERTEGEHGTFLYRTVDYHSPGSIARVSVTSFPNRRPRLAPAEPMHIGMHAPTQNIAPAISLAAVLEQPQRERIRELHLQRIGYAVFANPVLASSLREELGLSDEQLDRIKQEVTI